MKIHNSWENIVGIYIYIMGICHERWWFHANFWCSNRSWTIWWSIGIEWDFHMDLYDGIFAGILMGILWIFIYIYILVEILFRNIADKWVDDNASGLQGCERCLWAVVFLFTNGDPTIKTIGGRLKAMTVPGICPAAMWLLFFLLTEMQLAKNRKHGSFSSFTSYIIRYHQGQGRANDP